MKSIIFLVMLLVAFAPINRVENKKESYSYKLENLETSRVAKNCVIDGLVYSDQNGNGQRDPSEPGIGGVIVSLYSPGQDGLLGTSDDVLVAQGVTNSGNGQYVLNTVDSGSYRVKVSGIPAGYSPIIGNIGYSDIFVADCPQFVKTNFGYNEIYLAVGIEYFNIIYIENSNTLYLEWKTYFEENTAGFNIWSSDGDYMEKINEKLIYSASDPFGSVYYYYTVGDYCDCSFYLEEIDFFGRSLFYGPYYLSRV